MGGYRLYRSVVAGATGRVGEALTRQLLLSPLCAEVHTVGRAETRAFDGLAAADAKLRRHRADFAAASCSMDASALAGVDAAFCVLGARGGWADTEGVAAAERDGVLRFAELCAAAGIPHLSLLSSAWADRHSRFLPFARLQGEAVEACVEMAAFRRVSVFRPAVVVDGLGQPLGAQAAPLSARALLRSMPTVAQFLPTRFRQVPLDDLVLSMRLNVELCDAADRVESLDYRGMMMIIGRDGEP
mmetsp:Transcript_52632/g.118554  ORF Transcript_52632/g.118554 Transcript_52632/m.118554 type:complete len:244 (-) Transcript_52632:59-790(-)